MYSEDYSELTGDLYDLEDSEGGLPSVENVCPTPQYYYAMVARESIVLDKDEQGEVLALLRNTDNSDIKKDCVDKLCKANIKLVYKIAKQYSHDEDSLMLYLSAGNEGLLKAIENYQGGKAPFPNYAPFWIKQRILTEIYSNTLLKVPMWRMKAFIKLKIILKR